jgi:hypothetical protein
MLGQMQQAVAGAQEERVVEEPVARQVALVARVQVTLAVAAAVPLGTQGQAEQAGQILPGLLEQVVVPEVVAAAIHIPSYGVEVGLGL